VDRPGRELTAVFDGHNDALGALQKADDPPERFLTGLPDRHIDLARARAGGLAGGLFAINTPSPRGELTVDGSAWEESYADPVDPGEASVFTLGALGRAHALAAASDGAVAIVRSVEELDRARADGALAVGLHLEGAEAIAPDLAALDAWYAAGVRSLGPVWSRPNAFGHGVPFAFPSSPDTGPGLTEAGRRLVGRCAELGIAVDVSHLNAAGFADIARLDLAPIIASHSGCHALCASTRNLTDEQLRAIARSDGIVGIVFAPLFIRPDGRDDADVALSTLVEHVRHAAELVGVGRVALGSDFDGAAMPTELPDVTALPRLLEALRDAGLSSAEVEQIAWGNWRRVLGLAWSS
jgi:membrane dipeptidase